MIVDRDGKERLIRDTVEQGTINSPNRTQVQESSSAAAPLVNRGEGSAEDKAKWISFLNSPRNSHPNSPNREVMSRSPRYDPLPLEGSVKSDEEDETKDQDMVDLTKAGALPETEEVSMSIAEPADPYTQEEAEELFIQALVERSQTVNSTRLMKSFKPSSKLMGEL